MNQKDRLLTEEQLMGIYDWDFWNKIVSEGIGKALRAQDARSYAQALKDVGEWLEALVKEGGIVPHILLEALKQGEMPKEQRGEETSKHCP